jgi:hypothetical protein
MSLAPSSEMLFLSIMTYCKISFLAKVSASLAANLFSSSLPSRLRYTRHKWLYFIAIYQYLNNPKQTDRLRLHQLVIGKIQRYQRHVVGQGLQKNCERLCFQITVFKIHIQDSVGVLLLALHCLHDHRNICHRLLIVLGINKC